MIVSLRHFLGWLVSSFSSRADLVVENMALRRQLLHAQRPRRRLTALHKLFWVALRMCWSGWRQPLVPAAFRGQRERASTGADASAGADTLRLCATKSSTAAIPPQSAPESRRIVPLPLPRSNPQDSQ